MNNNEIKKLLKELISDSIIKSFMNEAKPIDKYKERQRAIQQQMKTPMRPIEQTPSPAPVQRPGLDQFASNYPQFGGAAGKPTPHPKRTGGKPFTNRADTSYRPPKSDDNQYQEPLAPQEGGLKRSFRDNDDDTMLDTPSFPVDMSQTLPPSMVSPGLEKTLDKASVVTYNPKLISLIKKFLKQSTLDSSSIIDKGKNFENDHYEIEVSNISSKVLRQLVANLSPEYFKIKITHNDRTFPYLKLNGDSNSMSKWVNKVNSSTGEIAQTSFSGEQSPVTQAISPEKNSNYDETQMFTGPSSPLTGEDPYSSLRNKTNFRPSPSGEVGAIRQPTVKQNGPAITNVYDDDFKNHPSFQKAKSKFRQ